VILTILSDPPEAAIYLNGERRAVTSAEGKYQFDKLPFGRYSVEVRKEGYHPLLRGFEAGSESPTLVFKLEPNLENYSKEFDSLMASGRLAGPDTPNAMELIERLSTKFPGRPEPDRMRGVLAAKFGEIVKPVINHTVSDWRGVTRNEVVQALDGAMNASAMKKDDVTFQAESSYLRGVLALRDWMTAGRPAGGSSGENGDLLGTARTEFEKALALQESFAAARYQLGVVALGAGDGSAAESAFLRTFQAEPEWMQARLGLGAAYHAQARYKEAIEVYRKAIEANPKSGAAVAGLGLARWAKGEKDGIKDLERSVQLDPSCAIAHFNLGTVYAQSKDKKQLARAEGELKTAMQLNPDNLEFANSLAEQRIAGLSKKKKK
jgi:tetratricopeptide (TPR) repeat protein